MTTATNNNNMTRPSSSLSCKLCVQQITFDNKHISQRTGKKIPLDVATNEAHDCPARTSNNNQQQQQEQQIQQQTLQRRYHQCNKGCGNEIYFDPFNKSQSGKYIPLSKETGLPHQCQ
jgi:hypothetical protein